MHNPVSVSDEEDGTSAVLAPCARATACGDLSVLSAVPPDAVGGGAAAARSAGLKSVAAALLVCMRWVVGAHNRHKEG